VSDRNNIQRVEYTKFLGIIIHQNQSWRPRIIVISSKIARSFGIITNSLGLYISITPPTPLPYPEESSKNYYTFSPPRAHSYPLSNKFKLINIFNIDKYQVSCFIFLRMQKVLPIPLSPLFNLNSDYHRDFTRQRDNLHIHFLNTNFLFGRKVRSSGTVSHSYYCTIISLFLIINKNLKISF